ncbi:hypothetical protein E2C01_016470 [Portunus trituberculatus]|uniref:Uncharacterized protein n=1 Tax=Portunus trituberculatus TaxID=210409 RepID=A0A5B7DQZ9_PORTR|nr:hypothetical protein [Portunus trituberculatus]
MNFSTEAMFKTLRCGYSVMMIRNQELSWSGARVVFTQRRDGPVAAGGVRWTNRLYSSSIEAPWLQDLLPNTSFQLSSIPGSYFAALSLSNCDVGNENMTTLTLTT